MKYLYQAIRASIKEEKVEGSTTHLTFLGILLDWDTVSIVASISADYKTLLQLFIHSKP